MAAGSLRARTGWAAGAPMPCTHAIDQARAGRDRRTQCKDDRLPGRGRRRSLQRQDDRIGVGLRLTFVATSEKAIASPSARRANQDTGAEVNNLVTLYWHS